MKKIDIANTFDNKENNRSSSLQAPNKSNNQEKSEHSAYDRLENLRILSQELNEQLQQMMTKLHEHIIIACPTDSLNNQINSSSSLSHMENHNHPLLKNKKQGLKVLYTNTKNIYKSYKILMDHIETLFDDMESKHKLALNKKVQEIKNLKQMHKNELTKLEYEINTRIYNLKNEYIKKEQELLDVITDLMNRLNNTKSLYSSNLNDLYLILQEQKQYMNNRDQWRNDKIDMGRYSSYDVEMWLNGIDIGSYININDNLTHRGNGNCINSSGGDASYDGASGSKYNNHHSYPNDCNTNGNGNGNNPNNHNNTCNIENQNSFHVDFSRPNLKLSLNNVKADLVEITNALSPITDDDINMKLKNSKISGGASSNSCGYGSNISRKDIHNMYKDGINNSIQRNVNGNSNNNNNNVVDTSPNSSKIYSELSFFNNKNDMNNNLECYQEDSKVSIIKQEAEWDSTLEDEESLEMFSELGKAMEMLYKAHVFDTENLQLLGKIVEGNKSADESSLPPGIFELFLQGIRLKSKFKGKMDNNHHQANFFKKSDSEIQENVNNNSNCMNRNEQIFTIVGDQDSTSNMELVLSPLDQKMKNYQKGLMENKPNQEAINGKNDLNLRDKAMYKQLQQQQHYNQHLKQQQSHQQMIKIDLIESKRGVINSTSSNNNNNGKRRKKSKQTKKTDVTLGDLMAVEHYITLDPPLADDEEIANPIIPQETRLHDVCLDDLLNAKSLPITMREDELSKIIVERNKSITEVDNLFEGMAMGQDLRKKKDRMVMDYDNDISSHDYNKIKVVEDFEQSEPDCGADVSDMNKGNKDNTEMTSSQDVITPNTNMIMMVMGSKVGTRRGEAEAEEEGIDNEQNQHQHHNKGHNQYQNPPLTTSLSKTNGNNSKNTNRPQQQHIQQQQHQQGTNPISIISKGSSTNHNRGLHLNLMPNTSSSTNNTSMSYTRDENASKTKLNTINTIISTTTTTTTNNTTTTSNSINNNSHHLANLPKKSIKDSSYANLNNIHTNINSFTEVDNEMHIPIISYNARSEPIILPILPTKLRTNLFSKIVTSTEASDHNTNTNNDILNLSFPPYYSKFNDNVTYKSIKFHKKIPNFFSTKSIDTYDTGIGGSRNYYSISTNQISNSSFSNYSHKDITIATASGGGKDSVKNASHHKINFTNNNHSHMNNTGKKHQVDGRLYSPHGYPLVKI